MTFTLADYRATNDFKTMLSLLRKENPESSILVEAMPYKDFGTKAILEINDEIMRFEYVNNVWKVT
jgi:hypothetical protein